MLAAALHGFALAFGLILPLGVQNTFVLTQGALHRRWAGALPAVVAAALCDTMMIVLAVSGVSVVALALPWFTAVLSWVGVGFLGLIGWITWRSRPADTAAGGEEWPLRRQVTFAASVSLLNPHAILDTIAVIGGVSLQYRGAELAAYTLTVIGVSWLWFSGLSAVGHLAGLAASGARVRIWLSRVSALIMWGLGLKLLVALT